MIIEAVIFDLDDLLIESEQVCSTAKEQLVRERGGTWRSDATRTVMGMSSREWSRYLRDLTRTGLGDLSSLPRVLDRLRGRKRDTLA